MFPYSEIRDGPGYIQLFGRNFNLVDSLTYEDRTDLDNFSPDVIVFESESTPIDHSLQRINGKWVGPLPQTRGTGSTPVIAPVTPPLQTPIIAPVRSPFTPVASLPINVPSTKVPLNTPGTVAPSKSPISTQCGLLGFNFFCPRPGKCGFWRRLFSVGQCN